MKAKVNELLARLSGDGFTGAETELRKESDIWFSHVNDLGSDDAYAFILEWMDDNLSDKRCELIFEAINNAELYFQCSDIMSLDISPLETEQRLQQWIEAGEAQAAFDEKLEMYRREY